MTVKCLWRTYFTLTDLEAVFRSLKSELGLRPIYHHKPIRADGICSRSNHALANVFQQDTIGLRIRLHNGCASTRRFRMS